MAVLFQDNKAGFILKKKRRIKQWIKDSVEHEHFVWGDICFVFEDDEKVYEINKKYLNHDWFTDVITFDYCKHNIVSGDIIISVERVKDNAKKYSVQIEEELLRVMIHGVLHLCGYNDETYKEKGKIRGKENYYLKKWFDLK